MPRRYAHMTLALVFALIATSAMFVAAPPSPVRAATTFTVNTTADTYPGDGVCNSVLPGGCTLRDALNQAADVAGTDAVQVVFDIPLNDPGRAIDPVTSTSTWVIRPVASYTFITRDNITIDGFTQQQVGVTNPNGPAVVVDGSNLNAALVPSGSAFVFSGSGNTVRSMAIINYRSVSAGSETLEGIALEFETGSNNNKVQGCYIGVDAFGRSKASNTIGILIRSNGNIIGGDRTRQDQRNVISGNIQTGIVIDGNSSTTSGINNKIWGNYIGLNGFGTAPLGNGGSGISIRRGGNNLIGTPPIVGQPNWVERNMISGNGQHGIFIQDSQSNEIYGNWIGTDANGNLAIPNVRNGIQLESTGGSSNGNVIGGNVNQYMRNTISGNGEYAIRVQGDRTSGTVIKSNLIGPAASGFLLTGTYTQSGILIDSGADLSAVGGLGGPSGVIPGEGNLIAGNKGDAVVIDSSIGLPSSLTLSNTVQGNFIGVSEYSAVNGSQTSLGNQGRGVVVIGSRGTSVIGNIVGGNTGVGVAIGGGSFITVRSNTIGLRRAPNRNVGGSGGFTVPTPNGGEGILVLGGRTVQIGGVNISDGNLIGSNSGDGIDVTSSFSTTVQSNRIGFLIAPDSKPYAVGNNGLGLKVTGLGATPTLTTATTGTLVLNNTIGANTSGGIQITNSYTSTLEGNQVNQNTGIGILVDGGGFNTQIRSGTVYSNTVAGVQVNGTAKRVSVRSVSISGNAVAGNPSTPVGDNRKAIVLNPTTPVDGNANNPNHDIDAPFGLRMNQAGRLTGRVRVTKAPNPPTPGSCQGCTFQFFTPNPKTLDGQGKDLIQNLSPVIDANGYFTVTLTTGIPRQLVVVATDQDGNSSEPAVFTPNYLPLEIGPARSGTASPGDTVRYTHWITNNSNIDLEDVSLTTRSTRGWTTGLEPPVQTVSILGGGGTRQVTLTVTLPKGGTSTVWAGNVDQSSITAKSTSVVTASAIVTDTTTVLGEFDLDVTPPAPNGRGAPDTTVPYIFTLENTGNLTGTSTVTATSFLVGPGGVLFSAAFTRAAGWTTTITPTELPLLPGTPRGTTVLVGIPRNAPSGTVVKTQLSVTVTSPALQTFYYTATTTVSDQPVVTIFPDREGDGAAGETTSFEHTVSNLGNTQLRLKLTGTSSQGSKVTFRSKDQTRFPIDANGEFTLNTANSPSGGVFNFFVDIAVSRELTRGDTDLITINLTRVDDGTTIGGVQDTINVTRGAIFPRLYLPITRR
ncbi:MAG TPA: right-handed parallel beta-helix repeat-containing protein [Roseiflexaceae bacterium]|nr:right-handed parallel beta-helix repeat-containing protein [Roseiflexaceae bacterium]